MTRIKSIGLALVAVFAFSAVAATASVATEGPFWKVEGRALAAGEEALLLATAKEQFVLKALALGITITCKGLTLPEAGQMQIIGQAIGNGDISKEVLEFTSCTQVGNGSEPECTIENGKIKTVPILNLLGYGNAARTGAVLVLFEPEVGTVFTTIKFSGTCPLLQSAAVSGSVVGLARVNNKPVTIGQEVEALHGEVAFPHPSLIFIERNKVLKHQLAKLTLAGGNAATLQGVALLLVDLINGKGNVEWGIFTA